MAQTLKLQSVVGLPFDSIHLFAALNLRFCPLRIGIVIWNNPSNYGIFPSYPLSQYCAKQVTAIIINTHTHTHSSLSLTGIISVTDHSLLYTPICGTSDCYTTINTHSSLSLTGIIGVANHSLLYPPICATSDCYITINTHTHHYHLLVSPAWLITAFCTHPSVPQVTATLPSTQRPAV